MLEAIDPANTGRRDLFQDAIGGDVADRTFEHIEALDFH